MPPVPARPLLSRAAAVTIAIAILAGCEPPQVPVGDPAPASAVATPAEAIPTQTTPAGAGAGDPVLPAVPGGDPITGAPLAVDVLATLAVKGRAPRTGYDRDLFGDGWVDVDRDGCDTRNQILGDSLGTPTFKDGTNGCVVLAGSLVDPYSGATIEFVRGQGTSEAVQIDHVVALSDAWQKGAQQWDAGRRVAFANDPLNLLAVDGPLNQQKGDGDAATWLPPAKGFRCEYVARQVAVKSKWGLWVTQAEASAIAGVLGDCPGQPLPEGGASAPVSAEALPESKLPEPAFASCAEARAAGAAPVQVDDPGYGPHLDGDGDGTGCEG